ncbi:MAG: hypothetical protein ABIN91_21725 [Mucilaginibacter sp.]|uniref:hypothetical protein n=1 Tax=Mucilaginibacter sp. TaxID=1882438 RepID=UPI0032676746
MKTLFSFLLFFFIIAAKAQTPALQKLWVGDNKLYLKGDTGNVIFFQSLVEHVLDTKTHGKIKAIYSTQSGYYQLTGNKLYLSGQYFSPSGTVFLIDTSSKDKLILMPANTMAVSFMESVTSLKQEKYVFKEIHEVATDTIKAEKIIYKIKGGYPAVRTTIYELGMDGKLRMFKEKRQYRGALGMNTASLPESNDEYFTATVSKTLMKQLMDILKISEFDKLPEKGDRNIDVTDHIIELYYNNKVKYITAGWMPFVVQPLNAFLQTLSGKIKLLPSAEKFNIVMMNDANNLKFY